MARRLIHLCDDERDYENNQSVGYIREHNAEEQHKPEEYQGVGIDSIIVRQGIHFRDHVDTVHPLGILQLDRRLFLRLPVCAFVGRSKGTQSLRHLGQVLLRHPSLQEEDSSVSQEPLADRRLVDILVYPIQTDLKPVPLLLVGDNGVHLLLPLVGQIRQLTFQPGHILRRCAGHILKAYHAEGMGPQGVQRCLRLCLVTDQQEVVLGLIVADCL